MKKTFHLFSCCILVKGARRSIIIDTQRRESYYIPNDLYNVLNNSPELLTSSTDLVIKEYFDFLMENELGFLTEQSHNFPKIDLKWETSSEITNAVLEIENIGDYNLQKSLHELSELACKNVLIKFYKKQTIAVLNTFFDLLEIFGFNNIDVLMPISEENIKDITKLINSRPLIRTLTLTNTSKNELIQASNDGMTALKTSTKRIEDKNTFKVDVNSFNLSLQFISESTHYNNYLNRKVVIDKLGYIKNATSFNKNYGHIDKVQIKDVISQTDFNRFWNVTKDQVEICKDCEHRYICPSLIKNEEEIKLKTSLCSYNPYTATW
ncbi:putative Grasp-with-spasm system SPASM domain peptide maturase [Tenacibaculum sp. 190524A02b]|uniref:grasp-with-spasm system SPASM domain peptide maturase n=1 Tax=Tenacibaculum vairaonense TaxID=3137860 RepID=UPI0032B11B23